MNPATVAAVAAIDALIAATRKAQTTRATWQASEAAQSPEDRAAMTEATARLQASAPAIAARPVARDLAPAERARRAYRDPYVDPTRDPIDAFLRGE